MKRPLALMLAAGLLAMLAGCALFPATKDRLDVLELGGRCSAQPDTLLVFLPGRYDHPQDLVKNGLVAAVRQRGIDADIVIPDLHFGYYIKRTAVDRLHEDVIRPARGKGYRHIRLVGISVGGFGALLYAQMHPGLIEEVMLIAPYLGESRIHQEIARAGGLESWDPGQWTAEDYERTLWAWLRRHGGGADPAISLGYGRSDSFAMSNRLLAAALPDERVTSTPGGHDWAPWLRIWETLLERRPLPACVRTAAR
jgi:pimeloyl-ACP methyl ester carboxylesterase